MLNSPELPKSKNDPEGGKSAADFWSKTERKRNLSAEQHAILIQTEVWKRYPELKNVWPGEYSQKFREFFNKNINLCVDVHLSNNKDKLDVLCEMIKQEIAG